MSPIEIMKAIAPLVFSFVASINVAAHESADTVIAPVKDVFKISGIGTIAVSKIESGTLTPGLKLEAVGRGKEVWPLTVGKIYINNKEVPSASAGQEVSIQIKGLDAIDMKIGMMISEPGLFKSIKLAEAEVNFLNAAEFGSVEIKDKMTVQLLLHGNKEFSTLLLMNDTKPKPGSSANVSLKFVVQPAARLYDKFSVSVNGKTIGTGTFLKFSDAKDE